MKILDIPIDEIIPNPHQLRTEFDAGEMASLVESIKKYGILQPLMVTPGDDGIYVLIAGERRLRAARDAGLEEVPAAIIPDASDREQLELALIENIQRIDLNPLEKAQAYKKLKDEFGMTTEEIGKYVGKDHSTIANTLRLLKLPAEIHKAILENKINERQMMAILPLFEIEDEEHTKSYCWDSREAIIKAALNGTTSVKLRRRANRFLRMTQKDYGDIPAVVLADNKAPFVNRSTWYMLEQCEKIPPWDWIVDAARQTCSSCDLYRIASEKMCNKCPAAELLSNLTKKIIRMEKMRVPKE
jgi:ParB/RepB/Spo0J family partition protein